VEISKLRTLVLDEADRLLEDGFADELNEIFSYLPTNRQTIFFSATFPPGIEELTRLHQSNAERISIIETSSQKPMIEQHLYQAEKPEKVETLIRILKDHPSKCTLIFCRTKASVDEIGKVLTRQNIQCQILHADLKQAERDRTMSQFRNGNLQVLVATDVAARGLDIEMLELVVNFDLPSTPEIYIHRIGRTGRAGRNGKAVAIATAYETELVAEIESATGQAMIRSAQ
jgi:ATP-independent RNA helicase DbpA